MHTELMMDTTLVEMLCCPVTRSKLRVDGDFLVGEVGGLRYPIVDGIPRLLPDQAVLPDGVKTVEEFRAKLKMTNDE
jgi:uncharacterized protein YbaR (Trm112 family)